MPILIFIAGPNGAGKTTFANEYLSADERRFEFVNADEIARGLAETGLQPPSDVLAGRMMLDRIDDLIKAGADLVVETTLASLTYARKIPLWRRQGYLVTLAYLRLHSVEDSMARVRRRMAAGGHGIPEDVIRRRFGKSLSYFETIYKQIVDEWYVWDSREGGFALVETSRRH
ncbi:MAG: AAA family ATPase [Xanthobacteraceae bacterium]